MEKYKITGIYQDDEAIKSRKEQHIKEEPKAILKYGDIEIELHYTFLNILTGITTNNFNYFSSFELNMFIKFIDYIQAMINYDVGNISVKPKMHLYEKHNEGRSYVVESDNVEYYI